MAFPTTPVLDNFNTGATQALTARTGWGAIALGPGAASYQTNATPTLAQVATASVGGNTWNVSLADSEVYVTIITFNSTTNAFMLHARNTGTSSPTAYALSLANSGANDFQIVKIVANVRTAIGTLQSQAIASGDSVGLSVIGTQVTSYYKAAAGSWVQKDTVSDSAVTGSGNIGFRHLFAIAGTQVDDFGGGTPVASSPSARPYQKLVRRVGCGA